MITARVRSTTGRLCFDTCLSVCPQGGYPYPIMLCNITQNSMGQTPGGYPARSSWGVPCPGGTLLGVPYLGTPLARSGWGGTLPGGYPAGGYPHKVPPGRVPLPQPGQDGGYPAKGYPVRTTEGVLTTRRAVCLYFLVLNLARE